MRVQRRSTRTMCPGSAAARSRRDGGHRRCRRASIHHTLLTSRLFTTTRSRRIEQHAVASNCPRPAAGSVADRGQRGHFPGPERGPMTFGLSVSLLAIVDDHLADDVSRDVDGRQKLAMACVVELVYRGDGSGRSDPGTGPSRPCPPGARSRRDRASWSTPCPTSWRSEVLERRVGAGGTDRGLVAAGEVPTPDSVPVCPHLRKRVRAG